MRLKENRNRIHSAARLLLVTATALLAVATCASALTLHINVLTPFPTTAAANSAHPPVIPAREAAEHVLSHTPPTYPPNAKKTRIQGIVVLKAIISKDGQVDRLSVDSGPKELQQSALDAVRHWTYKPFLLNGQPTEVETTINVHYSLVK